MRGEAEDYDRARTVGLASISSSRQRPWRAD